MLMRKIAFFLFFSFLLLTIHAQRTVIWCGTLITTADNEARPGMTILAAGNKIVGIEKGFAHPGPDDRVSDLKGKTVTPGWMDMHVHISSETSSTEYIERFQLKKSRSCFYRSCL